MKTAPTIEGTAPSVEEKRAALEALNGAEGMHALKESFDAFDAGLSQLKTFGPLPEGRQSSDDPSAIFEQQWGVNLRTERFTNPKLDYTGAVSRPYYPKYSLNAHTARKLFLFSTVVPLVVKWVSQSKDPQAAEALRAQLKTLVEERILAKDPRKAAQEKLQQSEKDPSVYFGYEPRSALHFVDEKQRAEDQRQVAQMEADRFEMDQELDRLVEDAMKPLAVAGDTHASIKEVAEVE